MSTTEIESILSERVLNMTESATLQMAAMARKMKEQGIDVITLSLGEPDFDTPQHIKDAALKAMQDGHTKYTAVAGNLDLREAIVAKLKRENGLDFKPNQIVEVMAAATCAWPYLTLEMRSLFCLHIGSPTVI